MKEYLCSNVKNVKVLVFDFDETLYYSPDVREYYIKYIKSTILNLSSLTEMETDSLMKEVGFTMENKASPSFSSSCGRFGIQKRAWDNYRIDNFFQINYKNAESIDNNILRKLSTHYPMYVVTNEVYKNILIKAERLGIDLSIFKKLLAPSAEALLSGNAKTKKELYQDIIESEHVMSNQVLVIGDRIKVDVEPMLELGGNGLVVTRPKEIEEFAVNYLL